MNISQDTIDSVRRVESEQTRRSKVHCVSELDGALLDFWVTIANGVKRGTDGGAEPEGYYSYCYRAPLLGHHTEDSRYRLVSSGMDRRVDRFCSDWKYGGPIIERERISIEFDTPESGAVWLARNEIGVDAEGVTPLIAAMRCYVASTLGQEVPK